MSSDDAAAEATGNDNEEEADSGHEPPELDMTQALHMAGHEREELGIEDVPDTGPVLKDAEDADEVDLEHHVQTDIATRGQDGF